MKEETKEYPVAVSNIAWKGHPLEVFLDLLAKEGAKGVEVASSLLWPEPVQASAQDRQTFRHLLADRGLSIVGLHSLLFTRPDLSLLSEGMEQEKTIDYLKRMVDLCADLGGSSLVLGGRRQRGQLSLEEANLRMEALLKEVGRHAASRRCFVALEAAAPPACEYITNLHDCRDMVQRAASPGVKVHFDSGAAEKTDWNSSDEFLVEILEQAGYFQANDYELQAPGSVKPEIHQRWARLLKRARYQGWIGIEMRSTANPEDSIRKAIRFVRSAYAASQTVSS